MISNHFYTPIKKMANTKRIAKELEQFNKHDSDSNRVYLCTVEDNLLDLRGLVIGPTDTPFEGAFLYFSIISIISLFSINSINKSVSKSCSLLIFSILLIFIFTNHR